MIRYYLHDVKKYFEDIFTKKTNIISSCTFSPFLGFTLLGKSWLAYIISRSVKIFETNHHVNFSSMIFIESPQYWKCRQWMHNENRAFLTLHKIRNIIIVLTCYLVSFWNISMWLVKSEILFVINVLSSIVVKSKKCRWRSPKNILV